MVYIQIILATMLILALVIMMMQVTNILNQYRKTVQQNYMLQVEVNRLKAKEKKGKEYLSIAVAKEKEAAMMLARAQQDNEWLESGNYVVERADLHQHLEDKRLSENKFELVE